MIIYVTKMKSFSVLYFLVLVIPTYQLWHWSDCSNPKHRVVEITDFDISPKPLQLPGTVTVTLLGNHGYLPTLSDYRLNVTMEKKILGHWHVVPYPFPFTTTPNILGTRRYDDLCEFLQQYSSTHCCPQPLIDSGLQCQCPFYPRNINMRPTDFTLNISEELQRVLMGDFRTRIELFNGPTMIGCVSFEMSFKVPCLGFLCG